MNFLSGFLRSSAKRTTNRYAILVNTEEADSLEFPDGNIVESWQHSDDCVMMIVESAADLSTSAAHLPGVRGVEKM